MKPRHRPVGEVAAIASLPFVVHVREHGAHEMGSAPLEDRWYETAFAELGDAQLDIASTTSAKAHHIAGCLFARSSLAFHFVDVLSRLIQPTESYQASR